MTKRPPPREDLFTTLVSREGDYEENCWGPWALLNLHKSLGRYLEPVVGVSDPRRTSGKSAKPPPPT